MWGLETELERQQVQIHPIRVGVHSTVLFRASLTQRHNVYVHGNDNLWVTWSTIGIKVLDKICLVHVDRLILGQSDARNCSI
ncbi:hypothetical protein IAQ61_000331 [Plenodomus lingam]|uniref:uncharacterized protein n=1 Tax=Leptosphaeria maculans TaxID=5022 RepID=UPI0033328684|nr:hypothetical protein IAQ61_000331 [Plenodomus lingam]